MVNILFQNAHVGNDSKGSEKEISIYAKKVVQADLPTTMKSQFKVNYLKNRQSTAELAEALEIPKSKVYNNLKKMGMVNRIDVWVPHILTEKHLLTRVT